MRRSKIIIIGAGPAGGACALTLARDGAEVLVLDKSSYPRTKVCGSGLSPHALAMLDTLGLRETIAPLHIPMCGVMARGPGGTKVHLRGAKGAWVVPRVELDSTIIGEAVRHGATFQQETKVTTLVRDGAGQVRGVETSAGTLEADLVICANGSPSRFETDQSPRYGIRTIMGWWKGARLRAADEGEFIWDDRLDGYYAWLFPEPHGIVNIGLTIPEDSSQAKRLKALFQDLLDELFADELRHAEPVGKWMGHPATLAMKVGPVAESHALWCGEAARLVSPATVEGISFAMESGIVAAKAASRGLDPARGLSPAQQMRYRASLSMRMMPKFWAGEGFVRLMRSERARSWTTRLFNPQKLGERAAMVVGESN
ncbi:MAG: NAD(P)/FAD-dependent oxidoreductase [Myxococcales bacterium]|nr:NAD(P)/FAD-dependent oxidoreductase [Myxococcales bacterium]MCB9718505.1 NAD(P)/FAD-dependent oxidoreductase [Myxococcales bacterium]